MDIDLNAPIWTIEHLAAALHLSVDAARELTYRQDFPPSRDGFKRNLWTRVELLAWFEALPGRQDGKPATARRLSTATIVRRAQPATGTGTPLATARTKRLTPDLARPEHSYTPREKKTAA